MQSDRFNLGIVGKLMGAVLVLAVIASIAVAGSMGATHPSAATGDGAAPADNTVAEDQESVAAVDPGTAALSGFAATGEQGRLAGSIVWVQVVEVQDFMVITFIPDDPTDPTEFNVTLRDGLGDPIESETVDAEVLRVGSEGYDFDDFENVSSDDSYTVWTTIDRNPNDATYVFPRLPSTDSSNFEPVTYTVRGAQDRGNERIEGYAWTSTLPGGTATANIVLIDEEESPFST